MLQNIYRVTDKDRAMQNGVSVEELKDMDLEAVMMTPRQASMVWQNVNKLKGLRGKGVGRARFWACMHMLMWEGFIDPGECGIASSRQGLGWDGGGDEEAEGSREGGNL